MLLGGGHSVLLPPKCWRAGATASRCEMKKILLVDDNIMNRDKALAARCADDDTQPVSPDFLDGSDSTKAVSAGEG